MEALIEFVNNLTADPQRARFMAVGLAALAMFAFGMGLLLLILAATDPVRRRLGWAAPEARSEGRLSVNINTMVGPVAEYVLPTKEIERSRITRQLVHAGFRGPTALQTFYGIKLLLAILLPVAVLAGARFFPDVQGSTILLVAMGAAALGVFGPNSVLERLVERRLKLLRNGFPDALDLLVVCVESGLGLSAAIDRVSGELGVSHPQLAEELALVNAETRAGIDRVTALKNLSERTGLADIRGLVSLLVQTLRFGTSVADSLRVYSEEFRDRRMQRAEEQAAKIGTKLIFPLVLCLFPSFFIVAVGPAILRIMQAFQQL